MTELHWADGKRETAITKTRWPRSAVGGCRTEGLRTRSLRPDAKGKGRAQKRGPKPRMVGSEVWWR